MKLYTIVKYILSIWPSNSTSRYLPKKTENICCQKEKLGENGLTKEFYPIFKEEITPIHYKFFQKYREATLSNSFYEFSIILIPSASHRSHKKTGDSLIKLQQHTNSATCKRFIHYGQVGFIYRLQNWFNIGKSIKLIYYINKIKLSKLIISIDGKSHDLNSQSRKERTFSTWGMHEKTTSKITFMVKVETGNTCYQKELKKKEKK